MPVLAVDCPGSHVEDADEDTSGFLPRGCSGPCMVYALGGGMDAAYRGN